MCKELDLTGVRIYSNSKDDVRDVINLVGERVYLSDDVTFESYREAELAEVDYTNGITFPFFGGNGVGWFKYIIRAEDAKFKKEKKTNVNIKEDMNFIKTWKSRVVPFSSELPSKAEIKKDKKIDMNFVKTLQSFRIHYLPELPSEDIKVEECTVVAVPGKKSDQINLYTRCGGEWILTTTIDRSISVFKELKEACDDLENAIRKLNKVSSNTENDELSSKLSKITSKVLQAKYELAEDILEPVENRDTEMWKGLINEYLKNS